MSTYHHKKILHENILKCFFEKFSLLTIFVDIMLVAVWGGLASIAGSAARAGGRILSISVTSPVPASHSRSKYKVVRMWPTGAETSTRRRRRGWQGWPASREPRWLFFFWCSAGWEQCEGEGGFLPIWYSVAVTRSEEEGYRQSGGGLSLIATWWQTI